MILAMKTTTESDVSVWDGSLEGNVVYAFTKVWVEQRAIEDASINFHM